ncbi:MAG: prolipoprotein diacylglyceryl transferase family protein [Candidatus Limnocylindrales bacterium]
MPIASITFDFDPVLRLTDELVMRWQTVALALTFTVTLVAAGIAARRRGLRADDLLSIVVGAVPGAIVAGRLGYALLHPEAFTAGPASLLDPSVGGLELAVGVAGGVVTAACVTALLGGSVAVWAQHLAVPLLIGIGGGKLAMVLGGSGQGLPSELPWATAYRGLGPWGSLAPDLPSHPAQAYEAIGVLALAAVLLMAVSVGAFRARDGRLLVVAIVGWTIVRAFATTTWRDPVVIAPLPAGGWLAVAVAIAAVGIASALALRNRWAAGQAGPEQASGEAAWPDPETRPPF